MTEMEMGNKAFSSSLPNIPTGNGGGAQFESGALSQRASVFVAS